MSPKHNFLTSSIKIPGKVFLQTLRDDNVKQRFSYQYGSYLLSIYW